MYGAQSEQGHLCNVSVSDLLSRLSALQEESTIHGNDYRFCEVFGCQSC